MSVTLVLLTNNPMKNFRSNAGIATIGARASALFLLLAPLVIASPVLAQAQAKVAAKTASISGAADPGVQIVVVGLDGEKSIVGVMGRADGTYSVDNLTPGRYSIKEEGPHHATRTLTLAAGQVGQVDLASGRK